MDVSVISKHPLTDEESQHLAVHFPEPELRYLPLQLRRMCETLDDIHEGIGDTTQRATVNAFLKELHTAVQDHNTPILLIVGRIPFVATVLGYFQRSGARQQIAVICHSPLGILRTNAY